MAALSPAHRAQALTRTVTFYLVMLIHVRPGWKARWGSVVDVAQFLWEALGSCDMYQINTSMKQLVGRAAVHSVQRR